MFVQGIIRGGSESMGLTFGAHPQLLMPLASSATTAEEEEDQERVCDLVLWDL